MTARVSTIAAPVVSTISFAKAKKLFQDQVQGSPCFGQRNHLGHMNRGRNHISAVPNAPTTQAVLHAVKTGAPGRDLELIDGYHRMQFWLTNPEGCPFKNLVLIVHAIESDSYEEKSALVDQLARTIDNRKAAKTSADRWFGGIREAGIHPVSKAYAFGTNVNAYLRVTVGASSNTMPDLMQSVMDNKAAHKAMDELFHFVEQHVPAAMRRKIFHPGISIAVFNTLKSATPKKRVAIVKMMRSSILLASGYQWVKPPQAVEDTAFSLNWLASEKVHAKMTKNCATRFDFFMAVSKMMEKSLALVVATL